MNALEVVGLKAVIDGAAKFLSDAKAMDTAQDNLSSSAKGVEKAAGGMGDAVDENGKKMDSAGKRAQDLTKVWVALGAGAGLALVDSIKKAAEFEHQISQVGAVSGATAGEMGQISDAALRIGKDTAFSASEAASAMEELAAQGVSTADIIGGAADAVVALAAAGGTDLVTAATAASTAMNVWKLKTGELPDVVNRLAGAANVSAFSVKDMTDGMVNGGLQAKSLGLTVQDTTTALAALSKGGFQGGAEAGTAFKVMLSSIAAPSTQAKDWIEKLGLQFRDSTGKIKPMADLIDELRLKMLNLNPSDRDNAMHAIFGTHGANAAIALMGITGDQFRELNKQMGDTNAADIAAKRMDNFQGSLEQLKGSIETIQITIGTKLLPILGDLINAGLALGDSFSSLPDSTQAIIGLGIAAAAATPILISMLSKGASLAIDMAKGLSTAQGKAGLFAASLTIVAAGVDAILTKTTGFGIMDRVFGDVGRSEQGRKVLADFNAELLAAGPNADKTKIALSGLSSLTGEFASISKDAAKGQSTLDNAIFGSDGRFFGAKVSIFGYNSAAVDSIDATKRLEEKTKLLASTLVASNAPLGTLKAAYDGLPPALQKIFDETTNVTAAWAKAHPEATLFGGAIQQIKEAGNKAAEAQRLHNLALDAAAKQAPITRDAFFEFEGTLTDIAGKAIDADKAIQALTQTLSTTDPATIKLKASVAFLKEELADLKDKGDNATAGDLARIKVLETAIATQEKMIKSTQDNETAIKDSNEALKLYIGEAGLGALLKRMVDLHLPSEAIVDVNRDIASAFSHMESRDIPGMISTFDALKEKLKEQPAVWQAVGQVIGPKLIAAIQESADGSPERVNLVNAYKTLGYDGGAALAAGVASTDVLAASAAETVGLSIGTGLSTGISRSQAEVQAEAAAIANSALSVIRHIFDSHSPSEATAQIGDDADRGLALGFERSSNFVNSAATALIRGVTQTAVESVNKDLTPALNTALGWTFTSLKKQVATEGPLMTQETINWLIGWRTALTDHLKTSTELTVAQVATLLQQMQLKIDQSTLPQASKNMATQTINEFIAQIRDTGSLANTELITLINTLTGTATTGGAGIATAIVGSVRTATQQTLAEMAEYTRQYNIQHPAGSPGSILTSPGQSPGPATSSPGGGAVATPTTPNTSGYGTTHYYNPETGQYQTTPYAPTPSTNFSPSPTPSTNFTHVGNATPHVGDTIAGYHVAMVSPSGRPYFLGPDGVTHVIPGYAHGGLVPGTGNRDSVLAALTPGEFVIPASVVSLIKNSMVSANTYAAASPNRYGEAMRIGGGGSGGGSNNMTLDMRGSSFTGTPSENADAIRGMMDRWANEKFGRDAFVSGVRS